MSRRAFTALMLWPAAVTVVQAQTFTTLASFDGTDGRNPIAPLIQAVDGNLYGTAFGGGTYSNGTVFQVTPSGSLTVLYNFCGLPICTDGGLPEAGLVEATNTDLFGADMSAIFKITLDGTLTTLCSGTTCPATPSGLVQASNRKFYGTSSTGGAYGQGTIYEITPSGALTTLYNFCPQAGCLDGSLPYAPLIQASDGNFYGTTYSGGALNFGTVFRITPDGAFTSLYSFCAQQPGHCTDGVNPTSALVQGADGDLYGTTSRLGKYLFQSGGAIFRITTSGKLTALHTFVLPEAGPNTLIQATDGTFYGTTYGNQSNGTYNFGTIFKITPSGALTTLYTFCSKGYPCSDGANPLAGLVQDTDGTFYGTTSSGGINYWGTIFSLSVGLGPFVKTVPTSGKSGAVVDILGTNLSGASSVTFNSVAAAFTLHSSTLITTTVPAGATTGVLQVVTASGTLSSNVPFRILP